MALDISQAATLANVIAGLLCLLTASFLVGAVPAYGRYRVWKYGYADVRFSRPNYDLIGIMSRLLVRKTGLVTRIGVAVAIVFVLINALHFLVPLGFTEGTNFSISRTRKVRGPRYEASNFYVGTSALNSGVAYAAAKTHQKAGGSTDLIPLATSKLLDAAIELSSESIAIQASQISNLAMVISTDEQGLITSLQLSSAGTSQLGCPSTGPQVASYTSWGQRGRLKDDTAFMACGDGAELTATYCSVTGLTFLSDGVAYYKGPNRSKADLVGSAMCAKSGTVQRNSLATPSPWQLVNMMLQSSLNNDSFVPEQFKFVYFSAAVARLLDFPPNTGSVLVYIPPVVVTALGIVVLTGIGLLFVIAMILYFGFRYLGRKSPDWGSDSDRLAQLIEKQIRPVDGSCARFGGEGSGLYVGCVESDQGYHFGVLDDVATARPNVDSTLLRGGTVFANVVNSCSAACLCLTGYGSMSVKNGQDFKSKFPQVLSQLTRNPARRFPSCVKRFHENSEYAARAVIVPNEHDNRLRERTVSRKYSAT